MFFQRLQHFGQNKPATNDITPLGHKESCRTQSDLLLWLKLLLSDWTPESYSGQLHAVIFTIIISGGLPLLCIMQAPRNRFTTVLPPARRGGHGLARSLSLSLSILRPLSRSQSLCLSASLSPHSPPLYPRDSTRFSGAWNQSHPLLTTPKYFCTCAFTQVVQQYIAVTNTTHLLGLLISSSPRPPY